MISQDRPRPRVEADLDVGVDEPALGRHRVDDLAGPQGEREGQLAPRGIPPAGQVRRLRVAQVMVGGAVGRVPPDPGHVEEAVRTEQRRRAVSVPLTLAVGERRRQQAGPFPGGLIEHVAQVVTAPAAAIAVPEDQPPGAVLEEDRVGDALLALTGHRRHRQRGEVTDLRRAKVRQRRPVHVAGDVQLTGPIQGQRHRVVRIPA